MTRGLGSFVLGVLAIPAGIAAQQHYSPASSPSGESWQVVDPASVPPSLDADAARSLGAAPAPSPLSPSPSVSPLTSPTPLTSPPPSTFSPPSTFPPPQTSAPVLAPSTSAPLQTFPPPTTLMSPASVPIITPHPQLVSPPVTTFRPLVPVTPPPDQYYLGRGLLGQPKLYVPQQPIRNFLRYLSP